MMKRLRLLLVISFCVGQQLLPMTSSPSMDLSFKVQRFDKCSDQDFKQIAQARIDCFSEYPYLYVGTMEYEEEYLNEYRKKAIDGFVVQVFDGDRLAGVLTGCAFSSNEEVSTHHALDITKNASKSFKQKGLVTDEYYYIGEAILYPQYRSLKIFPRLLWELGKEVMAIDRYKKICFLTVVRTDTDPRKPKDYQPTTEQLWEKIGCTKIGVTDTFEWPTIMHNNQQADDYVQNISNEVEFWTHESAQSVFLQLEQFVTQKPSQP